MALFSNLGFLEINKGRMKKDTDIRIRTINDHISFNELSLSYAIIFEQQITFVQD